MKLRLIPVVCLALALAACGSGDDDAGDATVTLLAPADYQAAVTAGSVFVVNVHIPYEGEIEGTDAFIPFDDVEAHAAELPADKSAPLYIYCRSGRMSAEATPVLQAMGYTNIIDLEGGMAAWEAAGLSLLTGAEGRDT